MGWVNAEPRYSPWRLVITPAALKPKIAVVDDDARMRGSIVAALRSTFEVVEGEDYEAADRRKSMLADIVLAARYIDLTRGDG